MKILPPEKLYLTESKIHGLGVFAKDFIKKGEIIETCPIHFLKVSDKDLCLKYYRFYWPKGSLNYLVCAWGWGNLYNHSSDPNATWESDIENKTFQFIAIKDISPDEEILVYYGDNYW